MLLRQMSADSISKLFFGNVTLGSETFFIMCTKLSIGHTVIVSNGISTTTVYSRTH